MSSLFEQNVLALSISERIQLVEDIWDSIEKVPESKVELERRLDDYHHDPDLGSPWDIVCERIKRQK